MEFNENVTSQASVLASILAGFALAISAQIALSEKKSEYLGALAGIFIRCSVACIFAVLFGLLHASANQSNLALVFAAGMVTALIVSLKTFIDATYRLLAIVSKDTSTQFVGNIVLPFIMLFAYLPLLYLLWLVLDHFGWVT